MLGRKEEEAVLLTERVSLREREVGIQALKDLSKTDPHQDKGPPQ